jgi:hypothetical protein
VERPRSADLTLVWFDPTTVLPKTFEALAGEVQSVFRAMGVEVGWRVGGQFGDSQGPEVPVILLPSDPAGKRRRERVMGLVVRDQRPHRAVWVFADTVRHALGGEEKVNAHELARALGRVVVHEVVHAVAPKAPHAREGLMQHALGREILSGPGARVDAACASAFVARLADEWRRQNAKPAAVRVLP